MGNNLFVTGFPYETTEAELSALFAACGTVLSAKILVERETSRSRGIGFVLMSTDAEAQTAIVKLNGTEVGHRKIFVNEARPAERTEEPAYTGPERRSGRDRRRSPPAAAEQRRPWDKDRKPAFGDKKPWQKKPWDKDRKPAFGDKKPWGKKPWDKDAKPAFGDKKPWQKKPWDKDRKPAFGDKKPWQKKPWDKDRKPAFGDKKPWEKKSGDSFPKKKWGAGGPNSGRKPGDRMSKPGGFKRKPSGGFRG